MDYIDPIYVSLQGSSSLFDWHFACASMLPHPGAMQGPMPQYYVLLDQRRIERVPRPANLSPPRDIIPAVTFSVFGWPGVCVKDILEDTITIDAANDTVFEEYGWRSIILNLEWPGYDTSGCRDPMHSRIDVRPGGRSITRQNLAREICSLLFKFHKAVSKNSCAPGWEKWALTIGPDGIRVPDVVLLSIHYYRNMWIPELYVIE